jgi:hypothetical protein
MLDSLALRCPLGQVGGKYGCTIPAQRVESYSSVRPFVEANPAERAPEACPTMGIIDLGAVLQSGLPVVSQIATPEALMVTSIAVACLGVAVMMLTRPRMEPERLENEAEGENQQRGEEMPQVRGTSAMESAATAGDEPRIQTLAVEGERAAAGERMLPLAAVAESEAAAAEMGNPGGAEPEPGLPSPGGASLRGPGHGASALIAKVACLLPAGMAVPGSGEKSVVKASRGAGGFQPGSRFSRSQQAFLRIPVVLSGRDESGAEFQEETFTLILLPQGAVIPMRRKMRAGDRMTLANPAGQKEAECDVFGVLPGPDGKMLVEVEFLEPQKSMWPVSFPAWGGYSDGRSSAGRAERAANPTRAPALGSSGS